MFKKALPHICIILAVSMLVFLVVDQVNSAMAFIDNQGTKIILMILMVLVVMLSILYIGEQRKRKRR